jgi:hypothetical protein
MPARAASATIARVIAGPLKSNSYNTPVALAYTDFVGAAAKSDPHPRCHPRESGDPVFQNVNSQVAAAAAYWKHAVLRTAIGVRSTPFFERL